MNAPRCILLDRDGTVIVDKDYLADPAGVELLPGAADGLRRMQEQGYVLVLLTNQSGVGRGCFTLVQMHATNERVRELLAEEGITLAGIYSCPHAPDEDCTCRKPRTGLAEQARAELGFDPAEAVMIGDKTADIQLGQAIGARTVLVRTGKGVKSEHDPACRPDAVADTLTEAAAFLFG